MEFTGERVVPDQVSIDLYREHIVRYLFAKEFIRSGHQVLDAGCGTGYGTYELAQKKDASVCGIDVSEEAILYASEKYKQNNLNYQVMDGKNLSFQSSTFDVVVSFEVIEHIEQPEIYLDQIKRVLRDDGCFVVSTPNKKMYSDALPNYDNPFHVKEYYYHEFVEMLEKQFQYVTIYFQDFMQGMEIKPYHFSNKNGSTQCLQLEQVSLDPGRASFFIAVCSNKKMTTHSEMIFPFSSNNILAEKDKYLDALKEEVEKRDKATDVIRKELEVKTEWIIQLQEEVRKRDEATSIILKELKVKTEWIEKLKEEIQKRDEATSAIIEELKVKTEWIDKLKEEIQKRDEAILRVQSENGMD